MEQSIVYVIGSIATLMIILGIVLAIMGRNDDLSQEIEEIERHKDYVKMQRENKKK